MMQLIFGEAAVKKAIFNPKLFKGHYRANKNNPQSHNCVSGKPASYFVFHETQWLSLLRRVVCYSAVWARVCSVHIWKELPRM